jgi:hypothetical protein
VQDTTDHLEWVAEQLVRVEAFRQRAHYHPYACGASIEVPGKGTYPHSEAPLSHYTHVMSRYMLLVRGLLLARPQHAPTGDLAAKLIVALETNPEDPPYAVPACGALSDVHLPLHADTHILTADLAKRLEAKLVMERLV